MWLFLFVLILPIRNNDPMYVSGGLIVDVGRAAFLVESTNNQLMGRDNIIYMGVGPESLGRDSRWAVGAEGRKGGGPWKPGI